MIYNSRLKDFKKEPVVINTADFGLNGPRLLESNVRSFLNAKGAVNKGIRGTILNERTKFFTYNNGISTVAKDIKTKIIPNEGLYIT